MHKIFEGKQIERKLTERERENKSEKIWRARKFERKDREKM